MKLSAGLPIPQPHETTPLMNEFVKGFFSILLFSVAKREPYHLAGAFAQIIGILSRKNVSRLSVKKL
jgi:hypothetical protein